MTRSKLAAFLLTSNNNIPGSSPPASICRLAEMYDANSLAVLPIFRHAADLSQKFLSGAASKPNGRSYTARPPAHCLSRIGGRRRTPPQYQRRQCLCLGISKRRTRNIVTGSSLMLHSTVVLFEERRKERGVEGQKHLLRNKAARIRKVEDIFIVANNNSIR